MLDSVVEWDPDTGKWRYLMKLRVPRWWADICVNEGNIYIYGGSTSEDLDSADIEVLNLQENHSECRSWARTTSGNIRADSMVNIRGQIFILGNDKLFFYESKREELVEIVSDEIYKKFTNLQDCVLAAADNLLFVFGTTTGPGRLVDCYNTKTGVWKTIAFMNHRHGVGYSPVGHNGALYFLEDCGGSSEVYDAKKNVWTVIEETMNHLMESNVFLTNRRDILKILKT